MKELNYIERNVAALREEIAEAEKTAGREGKTALVAAVKYGEDAELELLLSGGVGDVGENRVQQLLAHWPLYEKHKPRVHFIGTLQKNKIKYIIDKVFAVHSVDSASLAAELDRHAAKAGRTLPVFAEVNIGREAAKGGALPEEVQALCREIEALPHLHLMGLMTMAPISGSEAEYRAYFKETRELAKDTWCALGRADEPQLSMGMSGSFRAAILEGADYVRVGRRLFARENET